MPKKSAFYVDGCAYRVFAETFRESYFISGAFGIYYIEYVKPGTFAVSV